jgi:hypothetical protein
MLKRPVKNSSPRSRTVLYFSSYQNNSIQEEICNDVTARSVHDERTCSETESIQISDNNLTLPCHLRGVDVDRSCKSRRGLRAILICIRSHAVKLWIGVCGSLVTIGAEIGLLIKDTYHSTQDCWRIVTGEGTRCKCHVFRKMWEGELHRPLIFKQNQRSSIKIWNAIGLQNDHLHWNIQNNEISC